MPDHTRAAPGSTHVSKIVEVRPGYQSDKKQVRALALKEESTEYPKINEWFEKHYEELCKTRPMWVAVDEDGKVTGYLIARIDGERDIKCSRLFVLPEYGEDVKVELLRMFEATIPGLAKTKIHRHVYAGNDDEIAFLQRQGYTFGKYRGIEPGAEEVERQLMVKKLEERKDIVFVSFVPDLGTPKRAVYDYLIGRLRKIGNDQHKP